MDAFAVIADPTRRRILDTLREGDADVGTLVARLNISQPLMSKHLSVLREAGAVDVQVDGKRRVYRLAEDPLPAVLAWVTPYHRKWAAGLDRLAQLIDEEQS
ncbi:transcriptional regulator [Mycolicibacterium agri]|uniref:Putative transcription regulator, ArsR family protein n=1 Tax=Mycolicibacterium agri TaxID=36811 RepID=A0A2A7NH21_MYCAG|nr:metalloregulator ArsR/SmtB family transcription factor [Mycolicibacterium agri]PEG42731.1 transcriptional regulator [Mycolicibacterium agri]GFG52719.1 putative transcription regulator, ArsR family protein [Mycolicibacterium agri]